MDDDDHKKDFVVTPRESSLFNEPHFADNSKQVKMVTTLSGVVLVTLNAAGKIVNVDPFDGDGTMKTVDKIFKTEPVTTTGAIGTLTLTERLEIVGLHADANMAAIAVDRDITIAVTVPVITSGVILKVIETAAITLSNNQNGAFFFPSGPSYWTNDNTTIARVADQNPFPMTFEIGTAFQVLNDNIQVGDEMGIELWYKKA